MSGDDLQLRMPLIAGADDAAPKPPDDQPARDRILAELDANLLVEAGAGSGKTTSMVGRMVALVGAGRDVERMAAVTFTRKAAAELRERFQEKLECAFRDARAAGDAEGAARFGAALDALDRCFLGTIHAFCARLLRERPLEARVPPEFEEISGPDEDRLRAESWTRFLERLAARDGSRLVRAMADYGLTPARLHGAFRELSENPDVHYPAPAAPRPGAAEIAAVRRGLERLHDRSLALLPAAEHPDGRDDLQRKIHTLKVRRFVLGWDSDVAFMDALELAVQGSNRIVQKRWADERDGKAAARDLSEGWEEFCDEGSGASRLLRAWWAARYPVVIRFARAAAGAYQRDRLSVGQLTFQDLLVRTAALLRERPSARRELGERYRWLLVDEFQDTDPLQAEILFLLASEPAAAGDWRTLAPRPGALFVVGDPKQSIYRFRRADISVYNQVKRAFEGFGEVLALTTNFRSRPPIGAFVNPAFRNVFAPTATEHQAAFAELRVHLGDTPAQRVACYRFEPRPGRGKHSGKRISEPESALLASWIRSRIETGERRPADFMVLAMRKGELAAYARALEAHGVPVQVTGAGVGADHELSELILLLRALADPGDPVLTLAVLEGLFFGLSHQQLLDHARAGGRLSFAGETGSGPVADALRTLGRFWNTAQRLPADIAIATLVDELGILPWAAAGELGATRAGAVLYALDALRVAAGDGAASLAEAIEVLEAALAEEVDAPLVPGETDAVRVMNLHKAKGLEAPVVVLAYPAKLEPHPPTRHIARDAGGRAVGWLRVLDATQAGARTLAAPADWQAHEEAEAPYAAAEAGRLLYVAATRAKEELVVGRCTKTEDDGCWSALHETLDAPGVATEISPTLLDPAPRQPLAESPATLERRMADVAAARSGLGSPSYRARSITARVHGEGGGAITRDLPEGGHGDAGGRPRPDTRLVPVTGDALRAAGAIRSGGAAVRTRPADWGSAVHRALEAAGRGAAGARLRQLCRLTLAEFDRPMDAGSGEPVELDEIVALVEAVRASAVWDEVRRARHVLVEAHLAFAMDAAEAARLGVDSPAERELFEGTIDLAFQDERGRWNIVDFKTDADIPPDRRRLYERQLALYAEGLARADGA